MLPLAATAFAKDRARRLHALRARLEDFYELRVRVVGFPFRARVDNDFGFNQIAGCGVGNEDHAAVCVFRNAGARSREISHAEGERGVSGLC